MTLSSFLQTQAVRERFRREFPKPRLTAGGRLWAAPLTRNYGLVGAAFDYLLRFYVERLNPQALTRRWAAEHVLGYVIQFAAESGAIDLAKTARQMVAEARANHAAFLRSGRITADLLRSALLLAQLDIVYRTGTLDLILRTFGTVDPRDMDDLERLLSLVDPAAFTAEEVCLLNPVFGEASLLVRGADADLVIDGTLIEIKTTKNFRLKEEDFHQLVGYYTLYRLGGITDMPPHHPIERLGIYYARHAHLYTVAVRDVIDEGAFPAFLDWFQAEAARQFGGPPPR